MILFMRAGSLSSFAIPGDAHGIRLLCFVFDPFLGLLLSCRCQARGSCHKAAKPWPSIPCTLLGRRKELAFFSIFQHLQCFLTQVVSCGLRTARDIMHFSRRRAESSKSAKWMNLRTAFSIFFSSQVIKIQAWRKGGNLEVVCLDFCLHHTSHKMPQDPHLMVIRKHHGARYYWPKICKGYGMLQVIIDGYCTVE